MRFQSALLCSAVLHAGFLAVRPLRGTPSAFALAHSIEVTYEPIPIPAPVSVPAPRAVSSEPRTAAPVRASAPAPAARPARAVAAPAPQRAVLTAPSVPEPVSPVRPDPVIVPPAPAQQLPEWHFAQLQHKEQVRKYLKTRLNYPSVLLTGTVRLRLVLLPDGTLQQVQVLESSDPRLVNVALHDAQASAPYPAFPKPLRRRQVTYDYLVCYEPE